MGNSFSPGCRWWCLLWRLFVLSFFPLDVLDEIWDVIEAVSEGFLIYSCFFITLMQSSVLLKDLNYQKFSWKNTQENRQLLRVTEGALNFELYRLD